MNIYRFPSWRRPIFFLNHVLNWKIRLPQGALDLSYVPGLHERLHRICESFKKRAGLVISDDQCR
jgi:aromatic ring-opening dioxygenase LigB subunit